VNAWAPVLATHWYAVARSDGLRRGAVRPVTVLDRPFVLARTADGVAFALEDRCPHRQVALSAGCVTAQGLACAYHGWTFAPDGRLCAVPGLPEVAPLPAVRAATAAVHEHDGLVWLRPEAGAIAAPPALALASDPARRRYLWQTTWDANIVDALENFLDAQHTHAVHPGLVRRDGARAPARARLTTTDDGFAVDYLDQAEQTGWLYRLFESPRTGETARFAAPGSARIEYRYADGSVVHITLHFTPRDAATTDVFATLHVAGRWAPAWAVRWFVWPLLRKVGAQDARMLALQSANRRRFPGRGDASTALDLVRPHLARFWSEGTLAAPGAVHEVAMRL
jgi:phenylpropionate dioxygenase-like ring-hydroxylating dioxygenase large terminal subunit